MKNPVLSYLADLLFPPRCMICHKLILREEKPACAKCLDSLPEFDGAAPKVRFSSRVCVSFFYENDFRSAFLRYKFQDRREYAAQFGKWMSISIHDRLADCYDIATYVPISPKRRRARGYDQAELLCRAVCSNLGCPMQPLLRKIRHTNPQSGLRNANARAANASGAYAPISPEAVCGKRILLIDDILTTGATMAECCRVLLTAGAKSVCCAALATPRTDAER